MTCYNKVVTAVANKIRYNQNHKKNGAQNFSASAPKQKWCTDFTYLFLKGGEVRYNCTIIDLYDRSVVASITDRHITSDPAIRTLGKALESQQGTIKNRILHSDQGSQYTFRSFTEFCMSAHVIQSMSKAGYPYDNAPMNFLATSVTKMFAPCIFNLC